MLLNGMLQKSSILVFVN